MSKSIKLIWDFRGTTAEKTAEHHVVHLREWFQAEKKLQPEMGYETIHEMYALAFVIVAEEDMIEVRDTLKPHRGEWYNEA